METSAELMKNNSISLLETKYRDIADGNIPARSSLRFSSWLETKYRDIADGNRSSRSWALDASSRLETKYRDIADGNRFC